ncbi:aldo/keto reductase [Micromonospora sp. DT178]|uniref:aldo/keto reductase n=1 Tax=Micromonospora sp. DT178 TaxID=3393436 RepID=UPI003CF75717
MRFVPLDTPKPLSKIGLGTWQFGSREWGYGPEYERRAADIVRRAVDLGITVFDTAELYGFGRSERILGEALGDDRPKVVLATKILPILPVAPVVQQRAVASAARLGVTHLDLYQVHQANPLVADHTTMRGMRALQDVGLVGEVGVSNYGLRRWQVAEAALGRRVLSNQVRYSMVDRGPEHDLLPYAKQAGRLVIAYSPLAQGFLSGRYDAKNPPSGAVRRANPYFLPVNLERGATLIETLRQVADAHDATPSQIALAYLLRHPNVLAIPGASGVEQVERNAAAADIDLADDEHAALARAAREFRPITGLAAAPRLLRARTGK